MFRFLVSAVFVFLLSISAVAQQVRPVSSPEIYQQIARLKNLTHVLYLAAHPDDENTRLLAWLTGHEHIPTAYLSLTRGDGGQNILGPQLGAALGLIRTYELLEARKLDGAGQFFTRAIDFGFSKTWQETFRHWDSTVLTSDVVYVMRKYRPDVVICRFPPDTRAGHGQHAASAILARKAFEAVGNPNAFPDQKLGAWQPKRLLWNTFNFGRLNTTSDAQFKIRVGQYSPLIGMGYGELAGISRSIHRSQGAGTPSTPGVQTEYFELVAGDTLTTSLFDGIDISWNRVSRPEIGIAIDAVLSNFDFNEPQKSLPALLGIHKQVKTVKDDFWRVQKLAALQEIILSVAGFMAEATTTQPAATGGSTVPFTMRVVSRAGLPVHISTVGLAENGHTTSLDSTVDLNLVSDSLYVIARSFPIPQHQPVTQPYWLEEPARGDHFAITNNKLLGLPATPNILVVPMTVSIAGEAFEVGVPLSYKKLDPLYGDVVAPLRIVPALSVSFGDKLLLNRLNQTVAMVQLRAFAPVSNATVTLSKQGKTFLEMPGIFMQAGTDTTLQIPLSAQQLEGSSTGNYALQASVQVGNKVYDKTLNLIEYTHIPILQYFTPAEATVVRQDWKVTARRIGYVPGAGDFIPEFLKLAGLDVTILNPEELSSAARLKQYDAIISGIRAANVEKEMKFWMPVLLEYVREGGTLVMQYNTLQDLATKDLGPYPFALSSKRVTEEDAPVKDLNPQSPLWHVPNEITAKDWNGWVQERGLYFPETWDPRYKTLYSMHDAGEQPLEGSTLYTFYGKGAYVYTGLSFFRQLPVGNVGAIKLLMNMLSLRQ